MDWYYSNRGQQVGPLDDEAFARHVEEGHVTGETLVWNATLADWQPYKQVTGESTAVTPPLGTQVCCECGRSFKSDELIDFRGSLVCAECKPTFFQRVEEGAPIPGAVEYGGFWIRGGALFLDMFIIRAVTTPLFFLIFPLMAIVAATAGTGDEPPVFLAILAMGLFYLFIMSVSIAVPLIYYGWMVGKYGATLGAMACGLRIVRSDMSKLSYGRAYGRYFAMMITGMTMGIGYLMAAFTEEKTTLHDLICDTRVIKKRR